MIFSYLIKPFAGYALDGSPRSFTLLGELEQLTPLRKSDLLRTHPFQNLAAVCKKLRSDIEGYCHSLLTEHKIRNIKTLELDGEDWHKLATENAHSEKKNKKANRQTYRNLWIRTIHESCIWCGKNSTRRAMFDMLVYCCKSCDKRVYGKKVSRTRVAKVYKLKPLVWLRPDLVFENGGPRPLKVAMRSGSTFLLEKEVTALVAYCKENDPDKSISEKAVKRYGAEAERVADESPSKPILFWGVRQVYDPLQDVLSDVLGSSSDIATMPAGP